LKSFIKVTVSKFRVLRTLIVRFVSNLMRLKTKLFNFRIVIGFRAF
jgi:hypothetical protein